MRIKGTSITMVRGDSEQINVKLQNADGTDLALVTGDTVYMTIKKSIASAASITKTVTVFNDGVAEIVLSPSDTKTMNYDVYIYDVQVKFADNTVKTVIPESKFTLVAEVTV